jgi:hypothetical protein
MQRIGVLGAVAAFAGAFSLSANAEESCSGPLAGNGQAESRPEQGDRLFLSGNHCESATKRELRLSLFEIQQEQEDPMSVSLGVKQGGGILRFRIPFSF